MMYNIDHPVKVKMFGHVTQKRGKWHNGAHAPHNIVLYCTEKTLNMSVSGNCIQLEKGDLLLIPTGAFYKPLECDGCSYYFFHFEAAVCAESTSVPKAVVISPHVGLTNGHGYTCISRYESVITVPIYVQSAPYFVAEIFKKAEKLRPNKNFYDQMLLDCLLRELLIHVGMTKSTQYNKHLSDLLDHIERNYSKDLSLRALAKVSELSESYIARLFKNNLSLKPSEYVNKVRVSVATSLLSETNMSVSEIAEACGFSDVYYFSKTFKKIVGVSPSKIRTINQTIVD